MELKIIDRRKGYILITDYDEFVGMVYGEYRMIEETDGEEINHSFKIEKIFGEIGDGYNVGQSFFIEELHFIGEASLKNRTKNIIKIIFSDEPEGSIPMSYSLDLL